MKAARGGDEQIDAAAHIRPVLVDAGAAEHGRDRKPREFGVFARIVGDLRGQFARRGEHEHPAVIGQRSEEHTSELQSLMRISYAVFCLKKKKKNTNDSKTHY